MLERAATVAMSLPDPASVRAYAAAFDLATHGNGQPAAADFAGSLDAGPDAWSAALACAAATGVADALVRPASHPSAGAGQRQGARMMAGEPLFADASYP